MLHASVLCGTLLKCFISDYFHIFKLCIKDFIDFFFESFEIK